MLVLSILVFLVLSIATGATIFGPAAGGVALWLHALFILSVLGFISASTMSVMRAARKHLKTESSAHDADTRGGEPKEQGRAPGRERRHSHPHG